MTKLILALISLMVFAPPLNAWGVGLRPKKDSHGNLTRSAVGICQDCSLECEADLAPQKRESLTYRNTPSLILPGYPLAPPGGPPKEAEAALLSPADIPIFAKYSNATSTEVIVGVDTVQSTVFYDYSRDAAPNLTALVAHAQFLVKEAMGDDITYDKMTFEIIPQAVAIGNGMGLGGGVHSLPGVGEGAPTPAAMSFGTGWGYYTQKLTVRAFGRRELK